MQVYAPVTREGVKPDTRALPFEEVTMNLTHTARGLYTLTETMPRSVRSARDTAQRATALAQTKSLAASRPGPRLSQRELRQAAADLERVAAKLESDGKPKPPLPPPRSRHPVERPIERPPTPTIRAAPVDEDAREQAALFLQRLLRGRAVQNLMFLGKVRQRLFFISSHGL